MSNVLVLPVAVIEARCGCWCVRVDACPSCGECRVCHRCIDSLAQLHLADQVGAGKWVPFSLASPARTIRRRA